MRPWEPLNITTELWMQIPPEHVRISALRFTQDVDPIWTLRKHHLPFDSESGDPLPHVIDWEGQYYVCDGHHRIQARIDQGYDHVVVRVLRQMC